MVPISDALATLPPDVSVAFTAQVKNHEKNAAAGKGQSLAGCNCDSGRIEGLKGRLRGLKEASDAHRKDFNQQIKARADARDKLWGKGQGLHFEGGSISGFGEALVKTLMINGGGNVGKAVKGFNEAKNWAETAWNVGSEPSSLENWGNYGEKVLGKKAEEVFQQRAQEAFAAAREHFQKSGNYAAAAAYASHGGSRALRRRAEGSRWSAETRAHDSGGRYTLAKPGGHGINPVPTVPGGAQGPRPGSRPAAGRKPPGRRSPSR